MWWSPNQQRHARDASRNIALTMFFSVGLGPVFWIGALVFIGWLNGWFSAVGFSLQASAPAELPSEYQVRGEERIKNPFTWDAGVQDIWISIKQETNKEYIAARYHSLADAYRIRGDKAQSVKYLKTAINYGHQYEAEAKTKVERDAGRASALIYKYFLQRCEQSDCRNW